MIMKLGYRPNEAAEVFGSEVLLDEMVAAGWIKPRVQRNKLTIYDYSDLARCWARVCKGEMPGPLVRKNRKSNQCSQVVSNQRGGAR